eukprot:COSAG06_NODE_12353_length_1391_cov_1.851393_2_plen_248_part_00
MVSAGLQKFWEDDRTTQGFGHSGGQFIRKRQMGEVLTMDRAYFVAGLNLVARELIVVPPSGDLGKHPLTLPRLKPAERAPRANANVQRGRSIGEAPSESTRALMPLQPLQPDTPMAIAAQTMLRDLQAGCTVIVLYDNKNQSELTYRGTDEAVMGHWRPMQTTHRQVYKSAEGSEYMQMKCMIEGKTKRLALGRIEGALQLANHAAGITATASRAAALAAAQAVDSNCLLRRTAQIWAADCAPAAPR